MRKIDLFRNGKILTGLEVTKEDILNVKDKLSYVSVSEADMNNLANRSKDEVVGIIVGDIVNVLNDLGLVDSELLAKNPDCWFVYEPEKHGYKNLETSRFTFGEAIRLLKLGFKVAREGWNGKNMWLVLVPGKTVKVRPDTFYGRIGLAGSIVKIDPRIDMYTAKGTIQPGWLASQGDMLSNDWVVVK